MNALYYGDNLSVLREHIKDESVDLIYLDPPFNSKANYNILFQTPKGQNSQAQIEAFKDTWEWGEQAEREFKELLHQSNTDVAKMMAALRGFLGENDMMAYLVMMANRLLEMYRVLKPTGAVYLHCDPSASHYLKIVLDAVFGKKGYRNEIVWHYGQRTAFHKQHFSRKHDILFYYAKSDLSTFNPISETWDKEQFLSNRHDVLVDENGIEYIWTDGGKPGERYKRLVEDVISAGKPIDSVWNIPLLNAASNERLGYPTQKPLALLERIVKASSNENDVILDPFCGCGTAVHAAHKLGRQWIGIDITHLAIALIEKRLKDAFKGIKFEVHGTPKDLEGARDLANRDKYQFQYWACSLVNARPAQNKKKGADGGIDGLIFFQDQIDSENAAKKVIVSVKGGENVSVAMVRELGHVVASEKAVIGLFVTLKEPTKPMQTEAVKAGYYVSPSFPDKQFPKLQILTVEDLLKGSVQANLPPDLAQGAHTFKKIAKEKKASNQGVLF